MPYAEKTSVPIDRTRAEIEKELLRFKASHFAYSTEPDYWQIMFQYGKRPQRAQWPLAAGLEGWMHQPIDEEPKPNAPPKKIYAPVRPKCGKPHPEGDALENCDMVVGRRGWRQLGVYDG